MKQNGHITLTIIFGMILFFIAAIILNSIFFHLKISSFRVLELIEKNNRYENLIYYLHGYKKELFEMSVEELEQLDIYYFNNTNFPLMQIPSYRIDHHFSFQERYKNECQTLKITDQINLTEQKSNASHLANLQIKILKGKIPVNEVSFFIQSIPVTSLKTFLAENQIQSNGLSGFSPGSIEFDSDRFITDSCHFSQLSWESLRERLKLPISNDPVPSGVYLLMNLENSSIDAILIQGDLDELLFGIENSFQQILMKIQQKSFLIRYNSKKEAQFDWLDEMDLNTKPIFHELIVVNGTIKSIKQQNDFAFLPSSNLILFASGSVFINSSLITQLGPNQKSLQKTNFTIIHANHFFLNPDSNSSLIIDKNAKKLDGTIISEGTIVNHAELTMQGTLFASFISNHAAFNHIQTETGFQNNSYFCFANAHLINQFSIQKITSENE
jgi:hypothetical protein